MTDTGMSVEALSRQHGLSIDHQLAMRAAASRLEREFARYFRPETIERFLTGSYEQFAAFARFPNYVHLLAERFARERLHAFALVEGHLGAGLPVIFFVCQRNDVLSQVAEALVNHHAGPGALAWSGGIEPGLHLDKHVQALMAEMGIDIADAFPKPWAQEMVLAASVVVRFAGTDDLPVFAGRDYRTWTLGSPATTDAERLRIARSALDAHVRSLLAELGVPTR